MPLHSYRNFVGGSLLAFQKKLGGIRPIAIGYSKDTFNPSQLGVGVSGGCEAAIHATRRSIVGKYA